MNWYLEVLKKYADFGGRSRRKEYWYFSLFSLLISIVLGLIDNSLGLYNAELSLGILGGIYGLAVFIPSLAVSVRRLHDTDRSGWWLLLAFIPCLGGLVLLFFLISDSSPHENEYGPNPKAWPGQSY